MTHPDTPNESTIDMALRELDDLLEVDSGLTQWEVARVEEWTNRGRNLTGPMVRIIHDVWDRVCG